jgi:hypothetical protein
MILATLLTEIHEHAGEGFWDEVLHVTLDPAHIIAEIIFTIVFDGIIIALFYNVIFKKFILPKLRRDIHKDIDEAHGTEHNETCESSTERETDKKV